MLLVVVARYMGIFVVGPFLVLLNSGLLIKVVNNRNDIRVVSLQKSIMTYIPDVFMAEGDSTGHQFDGNPVS